MIIKRGARRIKKDYQHKSLQNPFFHQVKKGTAGRRFFKYFISAGVLLIIVGLWFFLAASFWRIQTVKVSGVTRVAPGEIEKIIFQQTKERRYLIFRQDNLFLFNQEAAIEKIIAAYNFASLEISKKWPRQLELIVGEKPYAFIFQEGTNLFYASRDAYLIKEVPVQEEDKQKYLLLENRNPTSLIGEKDKILIKDVYLNFILNLADNLRAYPELTVDRFIVDQEFNTIKVKFKDGPLVYFNTQTAAADQVNRLVLVKKEKIKDNFNKINYIDLRYGGRIFIN